MLILNREQAKAASHDERYGTGRAALYESHEELRSIIEQLMICIMYKWGVFERLVKEEPELYAQIHPLMNDEGRL